MWRKILSILWRTTISILPGSWVGWIEYKFRPSVGGFGVLNGQEGRRILFEDLMRRFACDIIVETGTYKAESTLYFSKFAKKVISIENSSRYYTYSTLRTARTENIEILYGQSQKILPELLRRTDLLGQRLFFYLDAHWRGPIPLRYEIKAIDEQTTDNLFMIDDFEVPGDGGYWFADYGGDEQLNLRVLKGVGLDRELFVFFPTLLSDHETVCGSVGRRIGYCVGTTSRDVALILKDFAALEAEGKRLSRIAASGPVLKR
jgi:hypothetical protein